MERTPEIVLATRVSKKLQERVLAEQQRLLKMTGIKPSLNEVTRMLIEKGLEAGRKK